MDFSEPSPLSLQLHFFIYFSLPFFIPQLLRKIWRNNNAEESMAY